MIDFLNLDDIISDEMLAAYIDGNATLSECAIIEDSLNGNQLLSEAIDIAKDNITFGGNFDWEIPNGDSEFWELGLSPAVTENNRLTATTPVADDTTMFNEVTDYGFDFDTFNCDHKELLSLDTTSSNEFGDVESSNDWNNLDEMNDGF